MRGMGRVPPDKELNEGGDHACFSSRLHAGAQPSVWSGQAWDTYRQMEDNLMLHPTSQTPVSPGIGDTDLRDTRPLPPEQRSSSLYAPGA